MGERSKNTRLGMENRPVMQQSLKSKIQREKKNARLELKRRVQNMQAQHKSHQGQKSGKSRNRRLKTLLFIVFVLLLLQNWCFSNPDAITEEAVPASGHPRKVVKTRTLEVLQEPLRSRFRRRTRRAYTVDESLARPWLSQLRLQVAARSLRLSFCFEGSEQPGVLRWSARIDPGLGTVSEQSFEPILAGNLISTQQQMCLAKVLEEPKYKLKISKEAAGATRVAIVVEF
jgi:hypothetical protein